MTNIINSEKIAYYSPYNFLTNPRLGRQDWIQDWINELLVDVQSKQVDCFDGGHGITIYFRKLDWDTDFFGIPTFRIEYTSLPLDIPFVKVQSAFNRLFDNLSTALPEFYLFAEAPSEDTAVIAGMGGAGWRLIETRVTYFRDDLKNFNYSTRAEVRKATESDIPELRRCAMETVNNYDRFHADDFFTRSEADNFLAIFIENSVKGFADEVMVPANGPANAFITAKYLSSPPSLAHRKLGKMVVSAVAPQRRGWYKRLIGEMSMRFKEQGVDTGFLTTQATNRAVIKVWAHHGYRFGRCTHIFSIYKRRRSL